MNRLYPAEFVYSSVFLKGLTMHMTSTGPKQRRKPCQNNNATYSSYKDVDDAKTAGQVDPFVHHLHLTAWQKLGLFLGSLTLAPLRLALLLLCAALASFLSWIGTLGIAESDLKRSLVTGWRANLQSVVFRVIDLAVVAIGINRVEVVGQQASPSEAPVLVAAPHSSIGDLAPVVLSRARPVVKEGMCDQICRFMQVIKVNRSSKDSRKQVLEDIKDRATENMKKGGNSWPQTIIFPEGTCTNGRALVTFKIGAFHPGVPVQPMVLRPRCVRDETGNFQAKGIDTLTWTWNQNFNLFWCLWFTMCRINSNFAIEFLPVYTPNEDERSNPELFASNVRAVMAARLGLPTLDVSYTAYVKEHQTCSS